jgi:hypothetical protein
MISFCAAIESSYIQYSAQKMRRRPRENEAITQIVAIQITRAGVEESLGSG